MKKVLYFFLAGILVVSVFINFTLGSKLNVANSKIEEINSNTASLVERNIRQSIINAKELIETNSKESLFGLQRSVEDLTASFSQWQTLNQTDEMPNTIMQKGLTGIEALRNTVIHHLDGQYFTSGEQLADEDIAMLESFHENLNRLLLVYHNIEGRVTDLKNPESSDGGLIQIASNLEEISRLYRHSSTPNKHPEYIGTEIAVNSIKEKLPEFEDYEVKIKDQSVFMKDGVHYYQVNYLDKNELVYTVFVDAIDGVIRNIEYKRPLEGKQQMSSGTSRTIAKQFLKKFYAGDVQEEMLYIKNDSEVSSLYSFRFIPLKDETKILSDAYIINVCPHTGKVIKYYNEFNDSMDYAQKHNFSHEYIMENNFEDPDLMTYEGLVVVRSFKTRFRPTLTHSFKTTQKDQQLVLYYDVETGTLVHQMYDIYEQI